jgi:hypothetical protein
MEFPMLTLTTHWQPREVPYRQLSPGISISILSQASLPSPLHSFPLTSPLPQRHRRNSLPDPLTHSTSRASMGLLSCHDVTRFKGRRQAPLRKQRNVTRLTHLHLHLRLHLAWRLFYPKPSLSAPSPASAERIMRRETGEMEQTKRQPGSQRIRSTGRNSPLHRNEK